MKETKIYHSKAQQKLFEVASIGIDAIKTYTWRRLAKYFKDSDYCIDHMSTWLVTPCCMWIVTPFIQQVIHKHDVGILIFIDVYGTYDCFSTDYERNALSEKSLRNYLYRCMASVFRNGYSVFVLETIHIMLDWLQELSTEFNLTFWSPNSTDRNLS